MSRLVTVQRWMDDAEATHKAMCEELSRWKVKYEGEHTLRKRSVMKAILAVNTLEQQVIELTNAVYSVNNGMAGHRDDNEEEPTTTTTTGDRVFTPASGSVFTRASSLSGLKSHQSRVSFPATTFRQPQQQQHQHRQRRVVEPVEDFTDEGMILDASSSVSDTL